MPPPPFHLRDRRRVRQPQARHSVPTWPLDEQALVRLPDGAVVTVACAKIALETFEITERLLLTYGDGD